MNPVQWFEIPARDLARAKGFYQGVFGYQFTHMDMGPSAMEMFPWEQGGTGCAGALIVTEGYTPSHAGTVVYFTVDDIEGTLAKVQAQGGKTLVPKMSIGEFGFIGQFEDSEGNRLGLHSQG
jgi:predicted enzyme related to lactoylglutathione lyase